MEFQVIAECSTTKARVSRMTMAHGTTELPTFMPVATQATMKSITPAQLTALTPPITLCLNNTYHLDLRPGPAILDEIGSGLLPDGEVGGAHKYQGWNRNLLTDSGGFQMVSLVALSKVTEEGVEFENPFDSSKMSLLTPERSMQIQHSIGADIIMQLDDVVSSLTTGPRVHEASLRSVRWLDRCIAEHDRSGDPSKQNLFAIVQGGLSSVLRDECLDAMLDPVRADKLPGFAIGGLSGGEEKDEFWKIVSQCTSRLPRDKPRYTMGVGYGEDLLVCVALGVDMADCVYPTRTARFGLALTRSGPINLRTAENSTNFDVIDKTCSCPTCDYGNGLSRAALWNMVGRESAASSAVTLHNLVYQSQLMHDTRAAIMKDQFPEFVIERFRGWFGDTYPEWAVNALFSVGIDLVKGRRIEKSC